MFDYVGCVQRGGGVGWGGGAQQMNGTLECE